MILKVVLKSTIQLAKVRKDVMYVQEVAILLGVGVAIGIDFNVLSLIQILAIVLVLSFTLTSLGLTIGSYVESLEDFQLIGSFVVFPFSFSVNKPPRRAYSIHYNRPFYLRCICS